MAKIKITKQQWVEAGTQAGWLKVSDMNDDAVSRRRAVRVTMSDGDVITTEINGTKKEIEDYYLKNEFVKADEKTMHRGTNVEFLW